MWLSVVCTLIDNDTLHHSGQNLLWTHSAVISSIVVDKSTDHAKPHSTCLILFLYNNRPSEPHVCISSLVCLSQCSNSSVKTVDLRLTIVQIFPTPLTASLVYVPHLSILVLCPRVALCSQKLEQPSHKTKTNKTHQERSTFIELFILCTFLILQNPRLQVKAYSVSGQVSCIPLEFIPIM